MTKETDALIRPQENSFILSKNLKEDLTDKKEQFPEQEESHQRNIETDYALTW
jgi:hypothetical protein